MPAVIEVKGSTSTVTVSWDKKNKEGEVVDAEKIANASDQMMVGGKDDYNNQKLLLHHIFSEN